MAQPREIAKFLSGFVFAELCLTLALWLDGTTLRLLGATMTPTQSMYAFFVAVFLFVLLASYGFFAAKRDAIQ